MSGLDDRDGSAEPTHDERTRDGLWRGDTGLLTENARRALLKLVRGPYLSAAENGALWSGLLSDESAVRSRLHDLFLDLVIEPDLGFAFVRNVRADDFDAPSAVRAERLTFLDTAMLLVLRRMLVDGGEHRVIVGRDEIFDQLAVYRQADRDQADFTKRLNASWTKMRNTLRVVHSTGRRDEGEDRVELSPVLALIVDAEQVAAIGAVYDRIAAGGRSGRESEDEE